MRSNDEQGFTLLEVMVALVILILGIGAFYQAFGSGLLAETAAQRKQRMAEVAANLVAGLGRSQTLVDGMTNGELRSGYRWSLKVEPYSPMNRDDQKPMVEAHLVTLDVQEVGQAKAAVHIKTLLLGVPSQ